MIKTFYLKNNDGTKATYETKFSFNLDEEFIYFHFEAKDSKLYSYSSKYNDSLFLGDVCEVFISCIDDNHYFEIEVAPNNANFLSYITNDGKSFHGQLVKENFLITNTFIKGNDYFVDIKIPLIKLNYDPNKSMKINAFRIDTDGEIVEKHLFALNPTKCKTFHKLEYFTDIKNL